MSPLLHPLSHCPSPVDFDLLKNRNVDFGIIANFDGTVTRFMLRKPEEAKSMIDESGPLLDVELKSMEEALEVGYILGECGSLVYQGEAIRAECFY